MTLEELSQYLRLWEQLTQDKQILESLEAAAYPGARVLTGMPHTPGIRDKVGDLAIEIAYMKDCISDIEKKMEREEAKVMRFISTIKNHQTRMIFHLRFLRCLTWAEVATLIGGSNTADGVKSICYRYLS